MHLHLRYGSLKNGCRLVSREEIPVRTAVLYLRHGVVPDTQALDENDTLCIGLEHPVIAVGPGNSEGKSFQLSVRGGLGDPERTHLRRIDKALSGFIFHGHGFAVRGDGKVVGILVQIKALRGLGFFCKIATVAETGQGVLAAAQFFHRAQQFVLGIQLLIAVTVTVDLEHGSLQLIFRVVLVHFREGHAAPDDLLGHVQRNGIIFFRIVLRLCADGVHGIIQQITLAGGELPNGPIVSADIIRGGELAAFVGGVGVYQFLTFENAVDSTGKCCVSLRQTHFGVPLDEGGAPLFQNIADLCLCDRVPLHRRRLVLRDNITDARIHLGEDIARANEHIGEHRFSVAAGHGVFVHRKPCKGGAGQMELHALVQTVLGGFDHLQTAPFQRVVEGHGGNLTGDHSHLAHLLGFIPIAALLRHGVDAGVEIIELHFAVCVGRHGLLRAVAGNGEGNTGHLAVLTGFDDLDAAIADSQVQIGIHGVDDGIPEGDDILHGAVRAIVAVAPDHHALPGVVSDGSNGHAVCGGCFGGDGQVVPIDCKGYIRLG